MANGGRIDFTVGFKVDESGMAKLRREIQEIGSISATTVQKMNPSLSIKQATGYVGQIREAARQVEQALNGAFNTQTGVMNLATLRNSLRSLDLPTIQQRFNLLGQQGSEAFLKISKAALTTSVRLKETNNIVDKMGQTLMNTLRWSISSSLIKNFTGAFQQAYGYVKHLDTSLNDIRIVTSKSADEMNRFAMQANNAAKALGKATTDYTEASLIYYQQGLSDEEVQARTETTLKAANVTGQSTKEVSEQLTAVWNGYQISAENTEEAVDKLAAVAATTAADLEELSTGMSKVAAAANSMGVDMDQLNATIATIESVTRQAPESVGTALKTIYARMGDLKLGKTDEDGLELGTVSGTLEKVGIHILDVNGELRDMGTVIEEIGEKWNIWTKAEQTAIAEAIAGKRQYNNLFALFDNWDMYTKALETSRNSMGTLQQQQDIYMQSTAAHIQQLKTQWEDLYDSILDSDSINTVTDGLNIILARVTDIIDAIGGGKNLLLGLVGLIGTVFGKQIGQIFGDISQDIRNANENAQVLNGLLANIRLNEQQHLIGGAAAEEMTRLQQQMSQYWHVMSAEEINASQDIIREIGTWEDKRDIIRRSTEDLRNYFSTYTDRATQEAIASDDFLVKDSIHQKQLLNNLTPLVNQLSDLKIRYKEINNAMRQYNDMSAQLANANTVTQRQLTQRSKALDNINGKLQNLRSTIENLHQANIIDDTKYRSANTIIQQLETRITRLRNVSTTNRMQDSFVDGIIDSFRQLQGTIDTADEKLQSFIHTLKDLGLNEGDINAIIAGLNGKLDENQYQARITAEAWTNLAGGITSVIFGLQSITNLGNILTNDNLTIIQKVTQSISSLALGLPMLLRGLVNLNSGLAVITGSTIFLTKATREETIANLNDNSSILARTAALLGLNATMASTITLVASITVALTIGLVSALKLVQRHYETVAESSKEMANTQQDVINKSKEEKDIIDNLANSYSELLSRKEENSEFSKEQEAEIYDLVRAYGDQHLTLKALSKDYDDLEEAIKGAQSAANDKLVQDLTEGVTAYSNALTNQIRAKAGIFERDNSGYDLSGLGGVFKHEDFRSDLAKLIGSDKDVINSSGHISWDYLNTLLTSDSKSLQEFLNKYQNLEASDQIRKLLSENNELITSLKENTNSLTQAKLNQYGYLNKKDADDIKDFSDYVHVLDKFSSGASKYAGVSYDEGRTWAKDFLTGYSDEFSLYDQKNTLAEALLDAVMPSETELEARQKEVQNKLLQYSVGGNVNLVNRPIIWNEDGSYSTVSTASFANAEGTKALNFTPYLVDEDGNYISTLSDTALEDYAKKVLNGVQEDYLHLQIGSEFTGEDALEQADAVAEEIHKLQEEFYAEDVGLSPYQTVIDEIYESLDKVDETSIAFIASHIALFSSLIDSGRSLENILVGLQSSFNVLEAKNHIVQIETVIDKNFAEKELTKLFADETFDIGMSQSEFNLLSEGDKYYALLQVKQTEIQQIEQLTEAEKQEIEAHAEYLDAALEEEAAKYSELLEKRDEYIQQLGTQDEELKTQFYDVFGENTNIDFEEFKESYNEIITQFQDIYNQAMEDGIVDPMRAVTDAWADVVGDNETFDEFTEYIPDLETVIKNWKNGSKNLNELNEKIEASEEATAELQHEYDTLIPTTIDYLRQIADIKASIQALNKDIDSMQSSYQALQDVMTEYNSTGTLSLDNLQKLLEMDDSYVAALKIENGQMELNEETIRQLADAKLQQARVEATELYMNELNAIAMENNVTASQRFYDAEHQYTIGAINDVITACGLGIEALNGLAIAKAAALKDSAATKEVTQAYYNRMQLIDSVAAQPTSQLLGKADKSKKSSGSKDKEPKQEKYLEREEDILRTINEELEQIESTLGRIQTINDHEWGIDAQKTLEVENELLDKQLEKLEEKRALQEKDLSIRRKQLEYEGVVFSEDGSAMLNAEGQLNALYAHYNTMVDTYNALSAAEQETYKNQLDAEKDRIDKIEKKIDEYESGFSDYQSTLDKLLDAHYAEIENEIKLFNNMVDVHLELNDAEKEWDDFWYDVIQDVQDTDFGGQIAKSMAKLETLVGTTINNTDSDVSVLTNHLLDTIAEVQAQIASANRGGEDSLFGDDTLASKENLENYRDKLMEALKAAKDEIDNISETYLKMLDDAQDKIDDQVDGWNSIGDQIQHDLDLIKLVSGEKAFNAFENFLNQQYQNDLNLINTQKQSKDFWKAEIDRYTQLLEVTDKNTVQWKTYSEALKKASENYKKAVQDLDKTVEEALKHLDEWRTNQVNAISTALDNAMSGGLGLETVEQEWKLINDYADKYLDNVERALDMEEYTNILNEAADAIGLSAANQEKLNRFRDEELKKLNEKEKLTSYDIAESKARLEILKQQMALEDAQRNKSNMRLRRDNQGNYVYQYVSNEEELEKAGQGTLTAKREWYELVKKRWKETSDWIIESEKQQANLLQQIDEAEKNGEIETANKLKELYKLNQQDIVNAYAEAEKNKQDLYLGTAQYFDYVDNAAILPNSKATVRQLVNEWVGGDGQEGFVSAVNTAITKLEETQNKYAERTAVILTEAGVQYQQLKENGIDPTIDSLSEMVDTNEELRYTLDDVNDALRQQENNLYQCEMAYHRLRDAAANAVYAANSALNNLAQTAINTVQRVQAAVQAAQNAARITANSLMNGNNLSNGPGSGLRSPSNQTRTPLSPYYSAQKYTLQPDVGGTVGIYYNGRKIEQLTPEAVQHKYNPSDFGVSNWSAVLKDDYFKDYKNLYGFATGGYTGAWGDSGKLAILHQKELVLNQDDTVNMLKAVETLREITNNQGNVSGIADTILRTSNIQAQALANVGAGLFQQLANMVNTSNTSTTRNMTVNADFSGVRSADAIYQALMELQNYGLQQNYSVDPMSSTPY